MNRRPLDWHSLEHALVAVARAYSYHLDQVADSGDKIVREILIDPDPEEDSINDLNLTEFAKDLARELGL